MSHNTQDSRFKGLTDQEVLQSRQKYGVNLLTPPKTSVNLENCIWRSFRTRLLKCYLLQQLFLC